METRRDPQIHLEDRKNPRSLAEFAEENQITEERVWEMIEEGTIAARFVNDSILILRDGDAGTEAPYELPEIGVQTSEPISEPSPNLNASVRPLVPYPEIAETEDLEVGPFPDDALDIRPFDQTPEKKGYANERDSARDPGSFLDSPYPEGDNAHDILLFAQDALARNEELSRQLLATKDELIRMKDDKIAWLSQVVQQKDREIRALNRQLEDFATLRKFENA